jgi:hypothetical protein
MNPDSIGHGWNAPRGVRHIDGVEALIYWADVLVWFAFTVPALLVLVVYYAREFHAWWRSRRCHSSSINSATK